MAAAVQLDTETIVGQRDLPLVSGEAHVRAFERAGWVLRRKTAGRRQMNHFILTKPGQEATLSIPNHKAVSRALLQKQIRLAGMTEAEYLEWFRRR